MLYLNPNSPKILRAKMEFHEGIQNFVFKRIDNIKKIKDFDVKITEYLFDTYINEYLDDIISGSPQKLIDLHDKINPEIEKHPHLKRGVQYVFNYKLFTDKAERRYDAYKLAESLDINTCPYCNRNYTNTVVTKNNKKIIRPQFDHYFSKAKHPLLALSFFNLIPSCYNCNSGTKGSLPFTLNNYLHPYLDNNIDDISFTYEYSIKTKSGLKIKISRMASDKTKNTMKAFAIEDIYNAHTEELLDLIKMKRYFSDKYLTILKDNLLKNIIVSKNDLYRIAFGTEYDSINFIKRPFSKFKNDILRELEIL